ncbi:endonuclease domain-containing protein [Sphingomonas sp. Leaf21]|uniref:endonuclease domain-containing protein n=1 Tax=Sphingomonas sp. Leaf21 TaxID=2876550 RepID=UPI001E6109C7|nr:endonuclease domain-containing protein [Sphingomonas sp. Leaf21]
MDGSNLERCPLPQPLPPAGGEPASFRGDDYPPPRTHPLPQAGGDRGEGPRHFRENRPTRRARELRLNPTDAERRLWRALSRRQVAGVRFNRQVPVGPYIADFAARSEKLIVEVDGGQHDERAAYDEARTHYLETQGWRVIRFWNNDVLGNLEGVVLTIERSLAAPPSPRSPPACGRGSARSSRDPD